MSEGIEETCVNDSPRQSLDQSFCCLFVLRERMSWKKSTDEGQTVSV